MVEEPIKFGNPWTVLPIKNAKQARDLIVVHLSDRDIDQLEKFEDFPNLETVWLNNNKVNINVFSSSKHYEDYIISSNCVFSKVNFQLVEELGWLDNKLQNKESLLLE